MADTSKPPEPKPEVKPEPKPAPDWDAPFDALSRAVKALEGKIENLTFEKETLVGELLKGLPSGIGNRNPAPKSPSENPAGAAAGQKEVGFSWPWEW